MIPVMRRANHAAGSAEPPVYNSVRTALGYAIYPGGGASILVKQGLTFAAGDLIVIGVRELAGAGEPAEYSGRLGATGVVFSMIQTCPHVDGKTVWQLAGLCTGAGTADLYVDVVSGGIDPDSATAWASLFTNIASATPHSTPTANSGSSGTVYQTTAQTTTVKTIQVGIVSKNSGSTGTWEASWTNGQGVTNAWSEGFKVNMVAASGQQTYKSAGVSAAWGALWAAWPVRTS